MDDQIVALYEQGNGLRVIARKLRIKPDSVGQKLARLEREGWLVRRNQQQACAAAFKGDNKTTPPDKAHDDLIVALYKEGNGKAVIARNLGIDSVGRKLARLEREGRLVRRGR